MSGYLANLASKTRGGLPSLTPRRPAPFENAPQGFFGEQDIATDDRGEAPVQRRAASPVVQHDAPPPVQADSPAIAPASPARETHLVEPEWVGPEASTPAVSDAPLLRPDLPEDRPRKAPSLTDELVERPAPLLPDSEDFSHEDPATLVKKDAAAFVEFNTEKAGVSHEVEIHTHSMDTLREVEIRETVRDVVSQSERSVEPMEISSPRDPVNHQTPAANEPPTAPARPVLPAAPFAPVSDWKSVDERPAVHASEDRQPLVEVHIGAIEVVAASGGAEAHSAPTIDRALSLDRFLTGTRK